MGQTIEMARRRPARPIVVATPRVREPADAAFFTGSRSRSRDVSHYFRGSRASTNFAGASCHALPRTSRAVPPFAKSLTPRASGLSG